MTIPSDPPVVLFDGACNLCVASVRWIINHDRRERFRFASLQSDAAWRALADAGSSPELARTMDSVVVISHGRVHTHSDAALAIARELGFPWSLAAAARFIPRPLRDAVYSFVARNRISWFGRQTACMIPSPQLSARFLDLGESPPSDTLGTAHLPDPDRPGPGTTLRAWSQRLIFAYLFLHAFCFPIGHVPFTEPLADAYDAAVRSAVSAFASLFLDLTITVFPSGSGDTTFNYVQLLVFALTAILSASAWTMAVRGRAVSARAADAFTTYIRYFLSANLLSYGLVKVFPLQMSLPGPDRLLASYGDSSPMGLLWTFIGASPGFQIFSGAFETLAGLLLVFRRTTLLGTLVALAVMLNVVAFNVFYDVPVKIFSSHLLLMSLFLLWPHLPRLAAFLLLNLPSQPVVLGPPARRPWTRRAAVFGKIAFVACFAVYPAVLNWNDLRTDGLLAPKAAWHGLYRVESFSRDGKSGCDNPDAQRWVRVGVTSQGQYAFIAIQNADGTSRRWGANVNADPPAFALMKREDAEPPTLEFSMPDDQTLRLQGNFQGAAVVAVLKRLPDEESTLLGRGFRWINEHPFNR